MIIAIGVMVAYVPGYIGSALPTGWVWLWLTMPLMLFWTEIKPNPIHWWGAAFLAYAAASMIWSPHGQLAFMQLCALASVFLWAANQRDIRQIVIGSAIGLGVSDVISLFQWAGYKPVMSLTDFPSGLFVNSNAFAEVSALILVLLLIHRLWWMLPLTIPGLLIGSRGVIIALLGTSLLWIWSRSKIAGGLLVATLGALTAYSVTTFHDYSISERVGMWRDTFDGVTLWGRGIGSFEYLYPYFSHSMDSLIRRPQYAHNDLLQLAFECGIGLIPLLIGVILLLRVKDNHRYAIVCFGIIGLFGFPLHIPAEAFLFACCAGALARRFGEFRVESVDSRSVLLGGLAEARS